ncbi:uncharacterized protein LOC129945270 [Eupeodes corollae]|uniref:uncharacterized protein LOC129945270 n=1 Tax=Eupeodes corollae TaxID=290404 RepID=UPI002490566A|nr:uncharacterized protein LOC129945270 [Eupeodes corollae]
MSTITRLDNIFNRLAYPRTITLDNAKQFASEEFESYCKSRGIILNFITPYWPQANGEIERQNRSLNKLLKTSNALGRNWKADLKDYYTTPQAKTGKTPTELMYGRTIRSKIPSVNDLEAAPPNTDFANRDTIQKRKGKESEDSKRHAKESEIEVGDTVLAKRTEPLRTLDTPFQPNEFTVLNRTGPKVTIEDKASGSLFDRNVAHVKKVLPLSTPVAESLDMSEDNNADGSFQEMTVEKPRRFKRVPGCYDDFDLSANDDDSDL